MKRKKEFRKMVDALIEAVGEFHAGLLIAGLLDALNEAGEGRGEYELRSVKMVVNGFFESTVWEEK